VSADTSIATNADPWQESRIESEGGLSGSDGQYRVGLAVHFRVLFHVLEDFEERIKAKTMRSLRKTMMTKKLQAYSSEAKKE